MSPTATGDSSPDPSTRGRAGTGLRVACGLVSATAALVSLLGVVALPWTADGSVRAFDLVSYPGQAVALLLVPVAMLGLALAAWRRWLAAGVALALSFNLSMLWVDPMTILWDLRGDEAIGSGFLAQGWGAALGVAAVLLGAASLLAERPGGHRAHDRPVPPIGRAELAFAGVGTLAFLVSLRLDRYVLTVSDTSRAGGRFFSDGWTDLTWRFELVHVVAPLAVLVLVLWAAVVPSGGAHRLLVWAGLAGGLGLDLLYRATSTGDLEPNGPPGFSPTQIAPATSGLVAVVVGALAFLLAGRSSGAAADHDLATQTEERA